jgi:hypothetical protein
MENGVDRSKGRQHVPSIEIPNRKTNECDFIAIGYDSAGEASSDQSTLLDQGEYDMLIRSFDEESPPPPFTPDEQGQPQPDVSISFQLSGVSGESRYGFPLSVKEAEEKMPAGDEGLIWYATIIPDAFVKDGKLRKDLNKRDFDVSNATIKPRRPSLPVTAADFFSSLTKIQGPNGPRYVFSGVLNGWPSLTSLELISLERRRAIGNIASPKDLLTGQLTWMHHWKVDLEGRAGVEPKLLDQQRVHRAKLRGAPWSAIGWSPDSPGFLFWFEAQHPDGPRLTYGTNVLSTVGNDKCSAVHMISHRYAIPFESPKDKLTYHSVVLLEWEHGQYCTIVEGAFLNGMGGYKGRSNWYHDKDSDVTALYKAFPPEMVSPWLTTSAEVRCFDVQAKSLDEMKQYIHQYQGKDKRFVDPQFSFSHRARLTFRTKSNIAQYLLNYISRDCSYSELKRNCQTFAADLCAFLAGKKNVDPFHPVNRIDYRSGKHYFLYDSSLYDKTKLKGRAVSRK